MTTQTSLELALDSIEQIETFAAAQQACPSLNHQQGLRLIERLAKLTTAVILSTEQSKTKANTRIDEE